MNALDMLSERSPLRLPWPGLLHHLVASYPVESRMLVGLADVSPESATASVHACSPARMVFDQADIVDGREFDRAALGLRLYQAALLGQHEALPLSARTWARLESWLAGAGGDEQTLMSWAAALLFNDMGKLHAVAAHHDEVTGHASADHDRVFARLLRADPGYFPGLAGMDPVLLEEFVLGLESGFNLGKALQMECPDVAWQPYLDLEPRARNCLFAHSLFDMLGVTGAVDPTQASPAICNDHNVGACLDIGSGTKPDAYGKSRIEMLGLDDAELSAIPPRLIGMARVFEPVEGRELCAAWRGLDAPVRAILDMELALTGLDGKCAIEPHYGPALLANARGMDGIGGWGAAMTWMAHVLWTVRHMLDTQGLHGDRGMVVANMGDLAGLVVKGGLDALAMARLLPVPAQDGWRIRVEATPTIDMARFAAPIPVGCLARLSHDGLEGARQSTHSQRVAFVGMGGGSDGLQAAQVALSSGLDVACLISVRSAKGPDDIRGTTGYGESPAQGVLVMTQQTRGEGRFLEDLPSQLLPTYLVLDADNATLGSRIQAAIRHAGGAGVVIGLDTGGDALHRVGVEDASLASPDQDLRTLDAIVGLDGVHALSMVLAPGIDSPDDAGDILLEAGAQPVDFLAASPAIHERYARWSQACQGGFLGKTPLAWGAALRGHRGLSVLDLPNHLVMAKNKPWNPFVVVSEAMAHGFLMRAASHLAAVRAIPEHGQT